MAEFLLAVSGYEFSKFIPLGPNVLEIRLCVGRELGIGFHPLLKYVLFEWSLAVSTRISKAVAIASPPHTHSLFYSTHC